jgi:hypothetical protein
MLWGKLRGKIKHIVLAAVAVVGLSAAAAPASADWGISIGNFGYYNGSGGYGGNRGYGGYGGYNRGSMHYDRVYHGYSHWTPGRGYHSHGHYDYVPHYTPRSSHGGHHHH